MNSCSRHGFKHSLCSLLSNTSQSRSHPKDTVLSTSQNNFANLFSASQVEDERVENSPNQPPTVLSTKRKRFSLDASLLSIRNTLGPSGENKNSNTNTPQFPASVFQSKRPTRQMSEKTPRAKTVLSQNSPNVEPNTQTGTKFCEEHFGVDGAVSSQNSLENNLSRASPSSSGLKRCQSQDTSLKTELLDLTRFQTTLSASSSSSSSNSSSYSQNSFIDKSPVKESSSDRRLFENISEDSISLTSDSASVQTSYSSVQCLICLEALTKRHPGVKLPCQNKCNQTLVHARCIYEWKESQCNTSAKAVSTCPLCRGELSTIQYCPPDAINSVLFDDFNILKNFITHPINVEANFVRLFVKSISEHTVCEITNKKVTTSTRYELYLQAPTTLKYPLGPVPDSDSPRDLDRFIASAVRSYQAQNKQQALSICLHNKQQSDMSGTSDSFIGYLNPSESGYEFSITPDKERSGELCGVKYSVTRCANGPKKISVCLPDVRAKQTLDSELFAKHSGVKTRSYKNRPPKGVPKWETDLAKSEEQKEEMVLFARNKEPYWLDSIQAYSLDFRGRVTWPSNKNFQLLLEKNTLSHLEELKTKYDAQNKNSAQSEKCVKDKNKSGSDSNKNNTSQKSMSSVTSTETCESEAGLDNFDRELFSDRLAKLRQNSVDTEDSTNGNGNGEDMSEEIVLQFGKVGEKRSESKTLEVFTLDAKWPLSVVQAFGICLSACDRTSQHNNSNSNSNRRTESQEQNSR